MGAIIALLLVVATGSQAVGDKAIFLSEWVYLCNIVALFAATLWGFWSGRRGGCCDDSR